MLQKKILSLLLSASLITPVAALAIETFDPEYVDAATTFIALSDVDTSSPAQVYPLYGMRPDYYDVNHDRKVDLADYSLLRKYITTGGDVDLLPENADVNHDDSIDFLDLVALKSHL